MGSATDVPTAATALPPPVVPFAVRPLTEVRSDLSPLHRDPPDHVDDPGPRTVLRRDAETATVVGAKRTLVARDPRPWTAVAPDLTAARAAALGRAVAAVVAADQPTLLRVVDDVLVLADGVAVAPGGGLEHPGAGHDETVAARLAAVPSWLRQLEAVALTVAEDLVVVDADARVLWAHVCAPSSWDPGRSGGRPLAALHGPIPDADRLRAASAALGRAIARSGPHVRWTWGVTSDAGLAHHADALPALPPHLDMDVPDAAALAALTFRAERQTTVPLDGLDAGLFTIRVHRAALDEVVCTTARAAALHATVASLSSELAAYKGVARWRPALLGWLAARAGSVAGTAPR